MSASAQLIHFKKIYKKVRSKKYYPVEQGLREFKADKKKKVITETIYTAVIGSFNTPNPHSLLLADFSNFNLSFLILPDVISNNIPIPFL